MNVTTLDAWTARHGVERIGLLKIDAEGHDFQVIEGASRLLREGRIALLVWEGLQRWPDAQRLDGALRGPEAYFAAMSRRGLDCYLLSDATPPPPGHDCRPTREDALPLRWGRRELEFDFGTDRRGTRAKPAARTPLASAAPTRRSCGAARSGGTDAPAVITCGEIPLRTTPASAEITRWDAPSWSILRSRTRYSASKARLASPPTPPRSWWRSGVVICDSF